MNRFYHSDDCVWVSTRSLSHYRRLAFYAREQRAKVDREPSELIFSSASNRSFDKVLFRINFLATAFKYKNQCVSCIYPIFV